MRPLDSGGSQRGTFRRNGIGARTRQGGIGQRIDESAHVQHRRHRCRFGKHGGGSGHVARSIRATRRPQRRRPAPRKRGAAALRYRARLHSCGRRLGPMLVDHLEVEQDLADRELARPPGETSRTRGRARSTRAPAAPRWRPPCPARATLSPLTRLSSSTRKRASPAGSACTCSKLSDRLDQRLP